MMEHPKAVEFDRKFQEIYEKVDREMEARHGDLFALHPCRPQAGSTSNPQMDGLYNLGASFTAGYGSREGRGYVVDLRIATLEEVPEEVRTMLWKEALELLDYHIKETFPHRELRIVPDGTLWKIVGDFSLGSL